MSVSQFSGAGSGRPPRTQPAPLPPLVRLATAALRVSGLVLDGPRSVPTQAKRDVTGLPIDARTFLADARALVSRVDGQLVFEPELAEEAQRLVERGAQLAADALVDEDGRRALQAAVADLRAALARLESLPRRVGLGVVGAAIEAVRDAMRRARAGGGATAAEREGLLRQAAEAERLAEEHVRYVAAIGGNTQTTTAMLTGLRDAVRRFEEPADDPLAAAAAQLEDAPLPDEADGAPLPPDEADGAPEPPPLPATQLEDEVLDEGRSGRMLGALRDEVVAFLRVVRGGAASGAVGSGSSVQLARLRTRAAAFPAGPLQSALLEALALARAALEAGAPAAAPPAPAAAPLPDASARDADADDDEFADGDEADPIEALVGRASTLFRRHRRDWALVQWQGVPLARATWVQEREMDTPRRRALLAALKAATGGDEDPQGRGWVREVVGRQARGEGRARRVEYRVRWRVDDGVPDAVAFEWVRRDQLVVPAVLDEADAAMGGGGDGGGGDDDASSSDDSDDDPLPPELELDAERRDDEGRQRVDALAWDAGSQRAKVSIRRAIEGLAGEEPFLLAALEEYATWRLWLLQCLVPREASLSSADWQQLGADLYEIDREKLDALKDPDSALTDEAFEAQQRTALLQRASDAFRRRRGRRERDTLQLRAQLRALAMIRARRRAGDDEAVAAPAPAAAATQPESQMDVEVRRALGFDDGETDARVRALSERLAADEASAADGSSRRWWRSFALPPPRMHTQERLLSGSKDAGGNRDQAQKRYLGWLRETHTGKEAALRSRTRTVNGRQVVDYAREWLDEAWGSPYSSYWPPGTQATTTTVNLEHIVCGEWLEGQYVVLECGYAKQDASLCVLANQSENSARRDRPLSAFGVEADQNNRKLYTPPESNQKKRGLLAKATAAGLLSYPLVQQETGAAGSKVFAGNFGVSEYARREAGLRSYALLDATAWERRVALVNAVRHRWHNPLVLRPTLLRQPRYADVLSMRLRGGRVESGALDCGIALLVDYVLRSLYDGPV
jgi:hypothetical protein